MSDNENAAKAALRLGAHVEKCPTCGSWFATQHVAKHQVVIFVDGEPADVEFASEAPGLEFLRDDIGRDLFCTKSCADDYVSKRQDACPSPDDVLYVYLEHAYDAASGTYTLVLWGIPP